MAKLYTIPFGTSFLDSLACGILAQFGNDNFDLSDIRVLLPTRRACRILRERFLALSQGKPLILPRLSAIGDVDADELDIWLTAEIAPKILETIPPAIPPLERILLLSSLIQKRADFQDQPARAFAVAQDLARLMDSVTIEHLSFDALDKIVPEAFATHWQITTQFLSVLWQAWPNILAENGFIEAADRRNRLLERLASYWQSNPPQSPVIAAGVTGTIPSAVKVINSLMQSPQAQIILPGVDTDLDAESWDSLPETHPQYHLKSLLTKLDIQDNKIELWPYRFKQNDNIPISSNAAQSIIQSRNHLLREMMRPAHTSLAWQKLDPSLFTAALSGFYVFEADTAQQEARAIALLLRETLETPEKTAALVTPDPALAKRVTGELARWGITIDNTAGRPATESELGRFLLLILQATQARYSPISLLSVLKHTLYKTTKDQQVFVTSLDKNLRGTSPQPGFEGLIKYIQPKHSDTIKPILCELETLFSPLTACLETSSSLPDLITAHLTVAQSLGDIWSADGAQEISNIFHALLTGAQHQNKMTIDDYAELLSHILATTPVRTVLEGHPRLFILGQIEARILQCDRMILSGLNEGTWPALTKADPWMSRPMRKDFGLPSAEADIGLSALDFSQSCGALEVILTRAKRDGDAPAVASRWWQKLEVVLKALGYSLTHIQHPLLHDWINQLDTFDGNMKQIAAPAPTPPVSARPLKLSVTQVETLMRDPYAIYAKMILGLRKLDELEEPIGAKDRGNWLHEILGVFTKRYPETLPDDSHDILMNMLHEKLMTTYIDDLQRSFWLQRFSRIFNWFIAFEKQWRTQARMMMSEEKKHIILDCNGYDFTLEAKADRIDRFKDNSLAVIDYKSSDPGVTKISLKNGFAPQLPLEALIALRGGMTGQTEHLSYLGYWVLSGLNSNPGEEKQICKDEDDLDIFLDETEKQFKALISHFLKEETAYHSVPHPKFQPKDAFQDYRHLARVAEWSVIDANGDE